MKLSIVIPAFNEQKLLRLALRKIKHAAESFEALGWGYELIVCDNNSTDDTARIAAAEGAEVVFEPVNQISRARNRGAAAATGDWLVFIDADSFPTAELFAEMAESIGQGTVIGGGCLVRMHHRSFVAACLLTGWNLLSRVFRWAAGSFIFCQTEAFRNLGGFSLDLYAAEEIDFSARLKALARQRKQKVIILRKHPLLTSARKLHLLTFSEHGRFFARAIFSPSATLRDRAKCFPWYDGRR